MQEKRTQMTQTYTRQMNGHKYLLCWILFQVKKWEIKTLEFNFLRIGSKVLHGNQGTQMTQTHSRRMNGHKYLLCWILFQGKMWDITSEFNFL